MGDERARLFCALRLPVAALERLEAWQRRELPEREGHRRVPRPNLHVTLAFLGWRPTSERGPIVAALRAAVQGAGPLELEPLRYRETPRVGMIVFADEEGRAASLALELHGRLHELGVYEPERRRWTPHVTVLRFRGRRPGLTPPPPDLGAVCPSEAALYHSVLEPSGARYDVLESVALGG